MMMVQIECCKPWPAASRY